MAMAYQHLPETAYRPAHQPARRPGRFIVAIVLAIAMAGSAIIGLNLWNARDPGYTALSAADVHALLDMDSNKTSGMRGKVVKYAVSLLGEVHYFWGGKSLARGKDEAWGKLRAVASEGSDTTGEEIPYGLDCSGYVAWVFRQAGLSQQDVISKLGLSTSSQWDHSKPIQWADLRPGDLVFQNDPATGENHVGICLGYDDKGRPVFIHCNATYDTVSVTHAGDVFTHARRPNVYR